MHVPDGFLDAPTSVATAVVAAGAVAVCLRGARRELDDRVAPLAGLVAVFVFAAQMVNFPVGAGTSGHLLGGALAAVLVGPRTATVCLTVVVTVQALLFADGGVSALGTNVLLLAVVGPWVGYAVFAAAARRPARRDRRRCRWPRRSAPSRRSSAAALVFVGLYAVGGAAPIPLDALVAAMGTWHLAHRPRRGRHHLPRRLEPRRHPARPRPRRPARAARAPELVVRPGVARP